MPFQNQNGTLHNHRQLNSGWRSLGECRDGKDGRIQSLIQCSEVLAVNLT